MQQTPSEGNSSHLNRDDTNEEYEDAAARSVTSLVHTAYISSLASPRHILSKEDMYYQGDTVVSFPIQREEAYNRLNKKFSTPPSNPHHPPLPAMGGEYTPLQAGNSSHPEYSTVSRGGSADAEDPGRPPRKIEDSSGQYSSHVFQSANSFNSKAFNAVYVIFLIILWYLFNVFYNVANKRAITMLPLPYTLACVQLLLGWCFFLPAWLLGLQRVPKIYSSDIIITKFLPLGLCHLLNHMGAVVSMGLGAVSFTHIVKAGEPVVTAILSWFLLASVLSWQAYLSLFPIVFGVALASMKELSFTWISFYFAMLSNLGSSGRGVVAKSVMQDKSACGEHLTPSNMYAILTIIASVCAIPLAVFMEYSIAKEAWMKATGPLSPYETRDILYQIVASAVWYYWYNQVAFSCLEKIDQISHAVANTLKRVVVITSSIIIFRTPVNTLGVLGSATAIIGTFVYSQVKDMYPPRQSKHTHTQHSMH